MRTVQDYPIILKADEVAEILGVTKRHAYEIMEQKGFPLIRLGRLKRVNRDAFFKWLEQQSQQAQ
jgi:excisionase family DNA binding protein